MHTNKTEYIVYWQCMNCCAKNVCYDAEYPKCLTCETKKYMVVISRVEMSTKNIDESIIFLARMQEDNLKGLYFSGEYTDEYTEEEILTELSHKKKIREFFESNENPSDEEVYNIFHPNDLVQKDENNKKVIKNGPKKNKR